MTCRADGRILLHCFAGCKYSDILKAVGYGSDGRSGGSQRGTAYGNSVIYDYQDEQGVSLYQVVRGEGKQFRQRRRVNDTWVYNIRGVRRVLYRLPELLKEQHKPVWIVEGEKDVDRAWMEGLCATTNPGGANPAMWLTEFNQFFLGREVNVLPDQDPVGRAHGQAIANALSPFAGTVKIIHLPRGKDLSEFLDQGGTLEQLHRLADDTPRYQPRTTIVVNRMSDVKEVPITWLWHNRIPQRKVTIIAGDPNVGKSFVTCDIAARRMRVEG